MTDTAASMEKMRETATDTESSIDRLQNAMDEVSEFAQTIGSITAQTNLLALNQASKQQEQENMVKALL